ncbi:MAG: YjjG family noncanonical pyrimidine nucleotidase [Bacteroidales bacterium]|nr:YjjG family noncanonical pyrimidine nucleotidase [Bacteroidales bacterium]
MKKYQHLFFDLDRTLWDFETNTEFVFAKLYDKYSLATYFNDIEQFKIIYNKHNDKLWALYREGKIRKEVLRGLRFLNTLGEVGCENSEIAEAMGNDYVKMGPEMTGLFPGTIEVLQYLLPNYKMYIITNGFKEVQYSKVERCGLSPFFLKIITSEDIGIQKPRPEIFGYALSSVNARKEESIMIGDDMEVDIIGAKKFGIDQVWFNPKRLHSENKATFEIDSLIKLKDIF